MTQLIYFMYLSQLNFCQCFVVLKLFLITYRRSSLPAAVSAAAFGLDSLVSHFLSCSCRVSLPEESAFPENPQNIYPISLPLLHLVSGPLPRLSQADAGRWRPRTAA